MKKIITIPNSPAPIGPYSQAILKNDTLFVSGQIPLNPATGKLQIGSIQEATQQVMENIQSLIKAAGFEMEDIVKCSIFIKSMADFADINAVYATFFQEEPPARETVEVKGLPMDVPIEISCIAIR